MPGQEISEEDRGVVDPKYFCSSCDLLLIEPMQTSCGHLICKSCVQPILRNSNPICPKDGIPLSENEVFPDGYTRRELGELQLHCVHNECDWVGAAKDLQAHLNTCDYAVMKCSHDQCNKEVKRFLLAKHLEEECLYRSVTCKHCEEQLPLATMEKHIEETCVATPLTCEHCQLTNIRRRDMRTHETEECEEIEVECDFKRIGCDHTEVSKRKHLRKHYKDASRFHTQLVLMFILEVQGEMHNVAATFENFATKDEVKAIQEVIDVRIKSMEDKLSAMIATIPGLMRRLDNLESRQTNRSNVPGSKDEIKRLEVKMLRMVEEMKNLEAKNNRLETQLREKTEFLERYRNKVDELDQSIAVMTTRFADLEPRMERPEQAVNYNGVLLWKIEDFQRKRQDAISGVTTALYSPHFYSSQFGYKMCAKIYMNGDGFGRGSHLSLFFVVMKGEYDALQSWPFQKKITMMLMDQGEGNHMIDAFHSDPQSSSFQRPRSDMNIASGSPLFMPLDSLNTREYIKDDVIFIKIIVD